MKTLDTSAISTTVGMPVKGGTLQFLQLAYQEAINALAQKIIGIGYATNTVYVLYGCVNTGSGSTYNISAGAVFYNGFVYLVPAVSFTAAGGQTAVATLAITQYTTNADPVLFTDNVNRNVHNISQVVIASATSGSGISDYSNFVFGQVSGAWVVVGSGGAAPAFGSGYIASNGSEAVRFRINAAGMVEINALFEQVGSTSNTLVFTLPAGFRPPYQLTGALFHNGGVDATADRIGGTSTEGANFIINTDGTIDVPVLVSSGANFIMRFNITYGL